MVGAAMTTSQTLTTATLLITGFLAPSAKADPPAFRPSDSPDGSVVVIRGGQTQVQGVRQKVVGQRSHATLSAQTEQGVVVMRPASGSFMRETTRLAAEADAREERAAHEEAREVNQQLGRTLQAVADAARAAEDEARTRSQLYHPVYVPRQHPPKVRPPTNQPVGR
jgi:hypothetical protein